MFNLFSGIIVQLILHTSLAAHVEFMVD